VDFCSFFLILRLLKYNKLLLHLMYHMFLHKSIAIFNSIST
jgi:hypothetical protein